MISIKNKKFGKLFVLCRDGSKHGNSIWLCRCDCGNFISVRKYSLTSNKTKSCGCLQRKHNLSKHPLYSVWHHMISRCLNKQTSTYNYYGGRGIKICERWKKVGNFIVDMYPSFEEGLSLDRINNDGNYEPSNCRWATKSEQCSNRRGYGSSPYKYVIFHKARNNWIVQVPSEGNNKYKGSFSSEKEAYNEALKWYDI